MDNDFAPSDLPLQRTNGFINWLNKKSVGYLAGIYLLSFAITVFIFSSIEYAAAINGSFLVYCKDVQVTDYFNLLYFNCITMLTVGYGDMTPDGWGKIISVIEAFLGVATSASLFAIIIAKLLMPTKNSIVFSKYAYYCTKNKRFLVIFLNTSRLNLVNVSLSSYFKLGGDWLVKNAIVSPFITKSVQTFYLDKCLIKDIKEKLREGDALRVGIEGGIGFTKFSTAVEYPASHILVIEDREELISYSGFHNPDLNSQEFKKMFHYHPKALTMKEYVQEIRSRKKE
jgi:hypothetical protein